MAGKTVTAASTTAGAKLANDLKLTIRDLLKLPPITAACILSLTTCVVPVQWATNTVGINGLAPAHLELADTEQKRAIGLSNRDVLPANDGMLFVFSTEDSVPACFWMKNTRIPLTVGFIDAQGILMETMDMQPQTLDRHCPAQPYRYAVELNQGWFARNHVVGMQILAAQNK